MQIWSWFSPPKIDRGGQDRSDIALDDALIVVTRGTEVLVKSALLPLLDQAEDTLVIASSAPTHHPLFFTEALLRERGWQEYFLGYSGGKPVVGVSAPLDFSELPADSTWIPLRELLPLVIRASEGSSAPAELTVTAVALSSWHERSQYCSGCGSLTQVRQSGWVRHCATCNREHYPRTDPAIIVLIVDDQDRVLLAHASYWSANRYSHLAGYVEPGESLEQAVHREVYEESRLEVTDVEYLGSQPWPFPGSIMTGFRARALHTNIQVDGDEIVDANFYSRDELTAAAKAGEVLIAPEGTIARMLLEQWWGGKLPF